MNMQRNVWIKVVASWPTKNLYSFAFILLLLRAHLWPFVHWYLTRTHTSEMGVPGSTTNKIACMCLCVWQILHQTDRDKRDDYSLMTHASITQLADDVTFDSFKGIKCWLTDLTQSVESDLWRKKWWTRKLAMTVKKGQIQYSFSLKVENIFPKKLCQ